MALPTWGPPKNANDGRLYYSSCTGSSPGNAYSDFNAQCELLTICCSKPERALLIFWLKNIKFFPPQPYCP